MPRILKVKDDSDKFHKAMPTFDIPFKLLINGKSQLSGKSTVLLSILLNPEFGYDKIFKGENIYIVSENDLDQKLKLLQITLQYTIPRMKITNSNEIKDTPLFID